MPITFDTVGAGRAGWQKLLHWKTGAGRPTKFGHAGNASKHLGQAVRKNWTMLALRECAPESVFIRVLQNRLVILFVQTPQLEYSHAPQVPKMTASVASRGVRDAFGSR